MKKPTLGELIEALLFVAVCALTYFTYTYATEKCAARGGVLVKTIGPYECVAVERK